jgi:transcriptional regulator GlxA family with amidase domain
VDARVEVTIMRMRQQLNRPISVPVLAAAIGLSVSHLTRLFRANTDMTPGAFLHHLRMTTARTLIEHTALPVAAIMAQVGIRNRSHFARDFRRAHGLNPRALRTQLRLRSRRPAVQV